MLTHIFLLLFSVRDYLVISRIAFFQLYQSAEKLLQYFPDITFSDFEVNKKKNDIRKTQNVMT